VAPTRHPFPCAAAAPRPSRGRVRLGVRAPPSFPRARVLGHGPGLFKAPSAPLGPLTRNPSRLRAPVRPRPQNLAPPRLQAAASSPLRRRGVPRELREIESKSRAPLVRVAGPCIARSTSLETRRRRPPFRASHRRRR
jgi:hypothetical protein